jgi:hypothetical protein
MKKGRILSALLCMFLLGTRDGYITLWKTGQPEPVRQFPYKAEYLPPSDRLALEKGIPVENPRVLAQLLEDYLS